MGLLDRLKTKPIGFPSPSRPFRLALAWEKANPLFTDITPKIPTQYDLRMIYDAAMQAKKQNGTVTQASPKILRMLPWVLFTFPEGLETKLGEDLDVVRDYLKWILQHDNTRAQANLLHSFLNSYPKHTTTFEFWRQGILKSLSLTKRQRLQKNYARAKQYGLLAPDGPQQMAHHLFTSNKPPSEVLQDAGLANTLSQGNFAYETYLETLETMDKALRSNDHASESLETIRHLSLADSDGHKSNALRFPMARTNLAEALLMPFASGTATPSLREDIRAFLVHHFGDPRIHKQHWAGVREEAKQIILRWLVTTTLEDFFAILDKTADEIWRYRKAFWGAYLERGLINEAWVVLGSRAKILARSFAKSDSYGDLKRPYSADQSVLLLKIGDLTIAEWSHNGTCRIWTEDRKKNPQVPVLYGPAYDSEVLRAPSSWMRRHTGSMTRRWQEDVRNFILRQEGISVPLNGIMPDHA